MGEIWWPNLKQQLFFILLCLINIAGLDGDFLARYENRFTYFRILLWILFIISSLTRYYHVTLYQIYMNRSFYVRNKAGIHLLGIRKRFYWQDRNWISTHHLITHQTNALNYITSVLVIGERPTGSHGSPQLIFGYSGRQSGYSATELLIQLNKHSILFLFLSSHCTSSFVQTTHKRGVDTSHLTMLIFLQLQIPNCQKRCTN